MGYCPDCGIQQYGGIYYCDPCEAREIARQQLERLRFYRECDPRRYREAEANGELAIYCIGKGSADGARSWASQAASYALYVMARVTEG